MIMEISTSPNRQELMQTPREIVAWMCIYRLEETNHKPSKYGDDVQAPCEVDVEQGTSDGAHAQDHCFRGMRILCRDTEGGLKLVVDFMNVFVKGAVVE